MGVAILLKLPDDHLDLGVSALADALHHLELIHPFIFLYTHHN